MWIAVWELWNTAAVSHSADEVKTWRRVLHSMWIGILRVVGFVVLDERKKYPLILLFAYGAILYEASEWMWRTMSFLWYLRPAFGYSAQ